jgi:hypothetical protein
LSLPSRIHVFFRANVPANASRRTASVSTIFVAAAAASGSWDFVATPRRGVHGE